APAGIREAATSSADWWSPSVTRILVRAPITPPALSMVATPVPTRSNHTAPVPRPGKREGIGGTESDDDLNELAPKDDGADATEQGQETEHEPEEQESISDLQADMGWGGVDRSLLKPRRSLPGVASLVGNMPTSPQTVDNDLPIERLVFVTANNTATGRYRESIDVEILRIWNKMDLSLHQRAMGLQGDATVVFAVRSSGKVSDKQLVRSSGYATLDQMALDAVPKRLTRFPVELDSSSLVHRYTFRYRNPLIVRGGGP
ncbi:MAG: TonB family protein, partial [Kiritimatiellia bacterium]